MFSAAFRAIRPYLTAGTRITPMFRCLRPGCPVHCGTRRRPGCADRMLFRALFLALAAALVFSLAIGIRDLKRAPQSMPVAELAAPAPIQAPLTLAASG